MPNFETDRTRFFHEMVDRFILDNKYSFDDDKEIDELLNRSMNMLNQDDFLLRQRPLPEYYEEMLSCRVSDRDKYLNSKNKTDAQMYKIALADILDLLGEDFEGSSYVLTRNKGRQNAEAMRRAYLELCLSIPQLKYEHVNRLLCKFLGAPPLHYRNPTDTIFAFAFISRDAGADGFALYEDQKAFIEQMHIEYEAHKQELLQDFQLTNEIGESAAYIKPGDKEAFKRWLISSAGHFDPEMRKYTVRRNFSENLRVVAQADFCTASLMKTIAENVIFEDGDKLDLEVTDELKYKMETYELFKRAFYDSLESQHAFANRKTVSKRAADAAFRDALTRIDWNEDEFWHEYGARFYLRERKYGKLEGDLDNYFRLVNDRYAERSRGLRKAETELRAMEIITGDIGPHFHSLYHHLGVSFMLACHGEMPEGFPGQIDWKEYYNSLVKYGDEEKNALLVDNRKEPIFLTALRLYLKGTPADHLISFKEEFERIKLAEKKFDTLMGGASLQYLLSDWHRAACCGARKAFAEMEHIQLSKIQANNLSKITSISQNIKLAKVHIDEDGKEKKTKNTEFQNVPRGLFILSILARINESNRGKYKKSILISLVDKELTDCGYSPLDVRNRFDFMFFAAARIAEVSAVRDDFDFDCLIGSLLHHIRDYIFDEKSKEVLRTFDFEPEDYKRKKTQTIER